MPVQMEGKGLVKNIFGRVVTAKRRVGKAVRSLHGSNAILPTKVENILHSVGDAHIHKIKIGRTSVPALITGALKVFSDTPYDQLFHLFMILKTDRGDVLLEKNEVINMELNPHIGAEYIEVPYVPHITVNELMRNTESFMGDKFARYSARDANCQDFIMGVLRANGMNDESVQNFVKQDTEEIFIGHPNLRKFANTVTDIAGRATNVFQDLTGGSTMKPNSHNNGMNTHDIEEILGHRADFKGVYSKDELPPRLIEHCWYILNMQSAADGPGTHWVALKAGAPTTYYDSFGIAPPMEVLEKTRGDIVYSDKQIQDIRSTACGWFCIAAILSDNEHSFDNVIHFRRFLNSFSNNTNLNDIILRKMLDRLL